MVEVATGSGVVSAVASTKAIASIAGKAGLEDGGNSEECFVGVNDVNTDDKTNAGKDSDKNKENTEDNLLDENGEKLGNVNTTKVVSAIGGSVAVTGILSVGGKVAYDQFTKNKQNKESRKGPQDQKEDENNTNNASPDSNGGSTTGQKDSGSFFNPWYVIAPGIGMILIGIIIVIFMKIKQNRKVETGYKFKDPDEDLRIKGYEESKIDFFR